MCHFAGCGQVQSDLGSEKPKFLRTKWKRLRSKITPSRSSTLISYLNSVRAAWAYTGLHSREPRAQAAFNRISYGRSYLIRNRKKRLGHYFILLSLVEVVRIIWPHGFLLLWATQRKAKQRKFT